VHFLGISSFAENIAPPDGFVCLNAVYVS